MKGFNKILKLIEDEQGKVFVVNEQGDPVCVLLSVTDYERLKEGQFDTESLSRKIKKLEDQTEELNELINRIQVEEINEDEEKEISEVLKDQTDPEATLYIEPLEDLD